MMEKLWILFWTFAKMGAITFGGGYAMLPILQREVVENKHWATEEELIDYYANQCRYNKIALVHGNYEDKVEFTHTLQDELISQGKSARVICTQENQKIYI